MEPDRTARLSAIAKLAVFQEQRTNLPAQILVAQWALESRWGERPAGHANYFGIKKAAGHMHSCFVIAHEFVNGKRVQATLEFADYDSLEDSCTDFAQLLTQGAPYRAAWISYLADRNWKKLLGSVAGTYATAPQYRELALQIACQPDVERAIEIARRK